MSNALAVAAVTAALQRFLARRILGDLPAGVADEHKLNALRISADALDRLRARPGDAPRINLNLLHVRPSAALRNLDPTGGEPPPLALELHYLATFHAAGDAELSAQILLAALLRALADQPRIDPADLEAAAPAALVHRQREPLRLRPAPLGLDEIAKIWSMYQLPHRPAVLIEVGVLRIDAARPARAPLPVLRRNLDLDLDLPPLVLDDLRLPEARPAAHPGDRVHVRGDHPRGAELLLRIDHPRRPAPLDLPLALAADGLSALLPAGDAALPAGLAAARLVTRDAAGERTSNALPLPLAPLLTGTLPLQVARDSTRAAVLAVTCAPAVRPDQRAALLLGDREFPAPPRPAPTQTITFTIPDAPVGEHRLRLRVDGVDSDLVDRHAPEPTFDPRRKAVITP